MLDVRILVKLLDQVFGDLREQVEASLSVILLFDKSKQLFKSEQYHFWRVLTLVEGWLVIGRSRDTDGKASHEGEVAMGHCKFRKVDTSGTTVTSFTHLMTC